MPNHLVLLRHGESEPNIARRAAKLGNISLYTAEFRARPDYRHRLTERGVEQAQVTGGWITRHVLEEFNLPYFDRNYVSPPIRAVETAGNLYLPTNEPWRMSYLVRERDYGDIDGMTNEEYETKYPDNAKKRKLDPLFWRPPGGESILEVAETRVRELYDTFHREVPGGSVIISTHGEFMWANRLAIEQPMPEEWDAWEADPSLHIDNCSVLHYTRVNPESGDVMPYIGWVRRVTPWINPDDPGQWEAVPRQMYSSEDLLAMAESVPRLFTADQY